MVELKRLLKSVTSAVLLAASLSSCGYFVYHAEDIEGWVVDAETGQPLEGVIVVANWELEGGLEGGVPVGELQILETVTDVRGRYYLPEWGPKFALFGALQDVSPGLLFFKRGYRYQGVSNNWHAGMDTTKSVWNGKTVKLETFKGSLREYAEHLWSLNDMLWGVGHTRGNPCDWESFPEMLKAMHTLEEELRLSGIVRGTVVSSLRSSHSRLKSAGCANLDKVIAQ